MTTTLNLTAGQEVWVRATVRDTYPGEVHVRLEFECPRMTQSVCVNSADVVERPEEPIRHVMRRDRLRNYGARLSGRVVRAAVRAWHRCRAPYSLTAPLG